MLGITLVPLFRYISYTMHHRDGNHIYSILFQLLVMSMRSLAALVFSVTILAIVQRDRSTHATTKHTPAPPIKLSHNISTRPFYTTGPIREVQVPTPTFFDMLSRKKIDNFIFNHYNHYKLEFTFVDLGYASNFMFGFSSDEYPTYTITEKIGFSLHEDILDGSLNLNIHKRNFNLTVRQYVDTLEDETVTTFNLSLLRLESNLNANLTHRIKNKECFTAIRKANIISHKCFGGLGSGKVKLDRVVKEGTEAKKQSNMLNPTFNLTRTAFDGLRGSGMHWQWVWGLMSGFSKTQFYALNHTIPTEHSLGLNLGHLFGEGEDFAFINGEGIPMEGLTYQFNQKVKEGTNITVKATKPRLEANFTVLSVHHHLEDMGILKVDMVKAQGVWAGIIQHKGKEYEFYHIAGLIQSCDSLF